MSVTTEQLVEILIRYLMGEEKKTQGEVTYMLVKEALIARGLMKEKTDGTV